MRPTPDQATNQSENRRDPQPAEKTVADVRAGGFVSHTRESSEANYQSDRAAITAPRFQCDGRMESRTIGTSALTSEGARRDESKVALGGEAVLRAVIPEGAGPCAGKWKGTTAASTTTMHMAAIRRETR
jgi:hypothetical protein